MEEIQENCSEAKRERAEGVHHAVLQKDPEKWGLGCNHWIWQLGFLLFLKNELIKNNNRLGKRGKEENCLILYHPR